MSEISTILREDFLARRSQAVGPLDANSNNHNVASTNYDCEKKLNELGQGFIDHMKHMFSQFVASRNFQLPQPPTPAAQAMEELSTPQISQTNSLPAATNATFVTPSIPRTTQTADQTWQQPLHAAAMTASPLIQQGTSTATTAADTTAIYRESTTAMPTATFFSVPRTAAATAVSTSSSTYHAGLHRPNDTINGSATAPAIPPIPRTHTAVAIVAVDAGVSTYGVGLQPPNAAASTAILMRMGSLKTSGGVMQPSATGITVGSCVFDMYKNGRLKKLCNTPLYDLEPRNITIGDGSGGTRSKYQKAMQLVDCLKGQKKVCTTAKATFVAIGNSLGRDECRMLRKLGPWKQPWTKMKLPKSSRGGILTWDTERAALEGCVPKPDQSLADYVSAVVAPITPTTTARGTKRPRHS